ncbi:PD-(D/E)XK nuclease family protein [Nocardioides sp. B-3]|uniref:PD-(D/E)XK nuclease family protein n=1 Tax=Nocardioides sp. B-3 TaxID=2895565 RepID=UPI0021535DEB|nr:PD-(D/E)XK nuclease family protein [Nocardioides sp. B-3]
MQHTSPAEIVSTPVDGIDVLGALSPSRAGDFMTCPLMYRYRTLDKLPEQPSADAVRGTVVHKVLEGPLRPAGHRPHTGPRCRPVGPVVGRAAGRGA